MENVSVAILCPFTKTPKEPESTGCPAGSFGFDLSPAPAKTGTAISTIRVTSLLLKFTLCSPCSRLPGRYRALRSLPARPAAQSCCVYLPSESSADTGPGAGRAKRETPPRPCAKAVPVPPTLSIAAINLPPGYPGTPMVLPRQEVRHFLPAQRLLRQARRLPVLLCSVHLAKRAVPGVRGREIPAPHGCGRSLK